MTNVTVSSIIGRMLEYRCAFEGGHTRVPSTLVERMESLVSGKAVEEHSAFLDIFPIMLLSAFCSWWCINTIELNIHWYTFEFKSHVGERSFKRSLEGPIILGQWTCTLVLWYIFCCNSAPQGIAFSFFSERGWGWRDIHMLASPGLWWSCSNFSIAAVRIPFCLQSLWRIVVCSLYHANNLWVYWRESSSMTPLNKEIIFRLIIISWSCIMILTFLRWLLFSPIIYNILPCHICTRAIYGWKFWFLWGLKEPMMFECNDISYLQLSFRKLSSAGRC